MVGFYRDVLRWEVEEERVGKWAVRIGPHKLSLQADDTKPRIASGTLPGSGNFCVLSGVDVELVKRELQAAGVDIVDEGMRSGAQGPIRSIYFHDPEGNLVEVANEAD